jgi:hypothetical protein
VVEPAAICAIFGFDGRPRPTRHRASQFPGAPRLLIPQARHVRRQVRPPPQHGRSRSAGPSVRPDIPNLPIPRLQEGSTRAASAPPSLYSRSRPQPGRAPMTDASARRFRREALATAAHLRGARSSPPDRPCTPPPPGATQRPARSPLPSMDSRQKRGSE